MLRARIYEVLLADLHSAHNRQLPVHCGGRARRRKPARNRRAWSYRHSDRVPQRWSHHPHHRRRARRKQRRPPVIWPGWIRWRGPERRLHCWCRHPNYCGRYASHPKAWNTLPAGSVMDRTMVSKPLLCTMSPGHSPIHQLGTSSPLESLIGRRGRWWIWKRR